MAQSEGHAPTDLASQELERSDRERQAQLKQVQSDEDLRQVMSFPWGRRKMWEWLGTCGVHKTAFREGSRETEFLLGMQNFGFLLQAEINRVCPDLYLQMLKEHKRG
jgi:hypothetical protein